MAAAVIEDIGGIPYDASNGPVHGAAWSDVLKGGFHEGYIKVLGIVRRGEGAVGLPEHQAFTVSVLVRQQLP